MSEIEPFQTDDALLASVMRKVLVGEESDFWNPDYVDIFNDSIRIDSYVELTEAEAEVCRRIGGERRG